MLKWLAQYVLRHFGRANLLELIYDELADIYYESNEPTIQSIFFEEACIAAANKLEHCDIHDMVKIGIAELTNIEWRREKV